MTRLCLTLILLSSIQGCYADLGAATEPSLSVDDQVGNVIIFGEYAGPVLSGSGEDSGGELRLIAEDCGNTLSGTYREGDTLVSLVGGLIGSGVHLESAEEATRKITFVGSILTVDAIEGAWFDEDDNGGSWSVAYLTGSVEGTPCPESEAFLE